jgi:hypothetical protein
MMCLSVIYFFSAYAGSFNLYGHSATERNRFKQESFNLYGHSVAERNRFVVSRGYLISRLKLFIRFKT